MEEKAVLVAVHTERQGAARPEGTDFQAERLGGKPAPDAKIAYFQSEIAKLRVSAHAVLREPPTLRLK